MKKPRGKRPRRVRACRVCRVCGCTEADCSGCIRRTGRPCWWVARDLCSACQPSAPNPMGEGRSAAIANHPLAISAACAVPLRIAEYRAKGGPTEADRERVRGHSQLLAEKGDVLQMGGGKKGEAARVFNALVDGLAVLAFQPGGVRFAGQRYEA